MRIIDYIRLSRQLGLAWNALDDIRRFSGPFFPADPVMACVHGVLAADSILRGRRWQDEAGLPLLLESFLNEKGESGSPGQEGDVRSRLLAFCRDRCREHGKGNSCVSKEDACEFAALLESRLMRLAARAHAIRPWAARHWLLILLLTAVCLSSVYAGGRQIIRAISDDGLRVTYYQGTHFERRICSRIETMIEKSYKNKRPALWVHRNNWSARWEGFLVVPADGEYNFFVQNDDGCRVYLDDRRVVDKWTDQTWRQSGSHVTLTLTAGSHRLVVEHYNHHAAAALRIRWSGGSIPANTVLSVPYLKKRLRKGGEDSVGVMR